MLGLSSLLALAVLVGCDREIALPCWAEVRIDLRAQRLADPVTPTTLAEASGIVDARLVAYGVDDRSVFTWADDRIAIALREDEATDPARALIVAVGQLQLMPIPAGSPALQPGSQLPPGAESIVDGDRVAAAQPISADGRSGLEIRLDSTGARGLADWTTANVGAEIAVAVDGTVIEVVRVDAPISDGVLQLATTLGDDELRWTASLLVHGPLRLALDEASYMSVDPRPCPPD